MKVISTTKAVLHCDREGIVDEYIQIDISIQQKDDVNKVYIIRTVDSMILNFGEENESIQSVINRYGVAQEKTYQKTYAEYDAQKEALAEMFPSELTGSELDDYLLQMGLLYNLSIEPIYGVEFEAR